MFPILDASRFGRGGGPCVRIVSRVAIECGLLNKKSSDYAEFSLDLVLRLLRMIRCDSSDCRLRRFWG